MTVAGRSGTAGPPSAAALDDWAQEALGDPVAAGHAVGAVAAAVTPGGVIWTASFGVADAERTPMRSGSTTKVLTATLLMGLVEAGAVGLDDPVDAHLHRLPLDQRHGRVRVRHLLTHTAGYEERFRGTLADRWLPAPTPPTVAARRHRHQALRPPGELVVYSNYAMALAGILVEDVTGRALGDLLEERILRPLGMDRSGVELEGRLPEGAIAEHWISPDGSTESPSLLPKVPFYLGSGGTFHTATDLGGFLAAHLADDDRLLPAGVKREMRSLQQGNLPGCGAGLGWWIYRCDDAARPGHPEDVVAFGHSGSTETFEMDMVAVPGRGFGLVVAHVGAPTLTGGLRALRAGRQSSGPELHGYESALEVARRFADREPVRAPGWAPRAAPRAGTYRYVREPESTSEKLLGALVADGVSSVRVTPEGDVVVDGTAHRPDPEGTWTDASGARIAFRDVAGTLHLVAGECFAHRRLPRWATRRAQVAAGLTAGALVLSGLSATVAAGRWRVAAPGLAAAVGVAATLGLAVEEALGRRHYRLANRAWWWTAVSFRATAVLTAALVVAALLTATRSAGVAAAGFVLLLALLAAGRAHVLVP